MNKTVLITGGAGYIGSHVVRQLGEAGYSVVVYDNCSTGFSESILYGKLIHGDLCDLEKLSKTFATHQFTAVLHFAASLVAPESVIYPLDYYSNNTRNTLNLLRCCEMFGVKRFIFSSTAAVYGEPAANPVTEETPTLPINPYGKSKLASEWMIRDYARASSLEYVILRYFNVAGASLDGRLGQMTPNASHLIRMACDAALDRRPGLRIFGTDFPTPDGTGVRDYIHVEDLATAHLDALRYLEADQSSQVLNCAYGQGYSVREVVDRVRAIADVDFPVIETERRAGDPACVIASGKAIREVLGWKPQYDQLDTIIHSALNWEIKQERRVLKSLMSRASEVPSENISQRQSVLGTHTPHAVSCQAHQSDVAISMVL